MSDKEKFAATGSAYYLPEPAYDEDLVLVDKGTPAGEVFRRYWMPVAKSDKIKDLPVQVKALGEDLILFRKPSGEVGLVYPRCIHRGTSLLWGRVTEKGIRCCYHGWTFETDGRCTERPGEEGVDGASRMTLRQPWYPVEERYGFVFAYMGPPDRKPPLPRYDLLENIPGGWEIVADDTSIPAGGAGRMPCNWLQHHENGLDGAHVPILHEHQFPPIMAQATRSGGFFEKLDDRVNGGDTTRIGPMMMDFKVNIIMPTVRVIPDPLLTNARPDGKSDQLSWTLPKDNTDTIVFTAIVRPKDAAPGAPERYNGKAWKDLTFEEHQRYPGDFEAQTGQGLITFHSEEHLFAQDKGIVLLRRQWREAIKTIRAGGDPPGAFGSNPYVETTAGAKMMANPDFVVPA